ncbi:tRNA pseudouridine(55) synthase TruB [Alteromonas gilva]|uniref:tRNA pseudouridine synthase B n=1 Tax=Alteromonas gilva TaxID=2987522 RepID=A0ABT5L4Q6_9ALTE|nr:tRNA pseudouridine(55) synthase TruB [Alteromonas gilva]MDC8830753.1 tRNA pseudouridine(55) synthase TruB [Alteromonas gilva]
MARKRKGRAVNGIVLIDKPLGGSSNQILQKVRWIYQAQKAGHTGALDPLATGMLPVCLGEATKFSQFLLDADKEYEVTARLGIRTTTSDADGEVVAEKPVEVSDTDVREACLSFLGESKQIPSMFSALKYQGKPLYFYARQGIEVPREARDITIFALEITRIALPDVDMRVHCSKGTYIRSLVDDIGQKLGCGAYVTRLHRTKVADYPTANMISVDELEAMVDPDPENREFAAIDGLLLPMDTAVKSLPCVDIDTAETHRFQHGQSVTPRSTDELQAGQVYRVYNSDVSPAQFLGVGEGLRAPKDQKPTGDQVFVAPRRTVVYND